MGEIFFRAVLEERGQGAAIVLDEKQVAEVGEGAKRFAVRATLNGYSWRTSVVRMRDEFLLVTNREVRKAAHAEAGDEVAVELALDTEERTVEVPEALASALAEDDVAQDAFHSLAYTYRKKFARWVVEAKKESTRERRVAKVVEMLRDGRTLS
jgi:hypothetical protein